MAEHEPDPADDSALAAMLDPDYARGLAEYDEAYMKATSPIWEERYLKEGRRWQVEKAVDIHPDHLPANPERAH
jgi:molybdopterin synthase catalytic subunit